jgi:hypothetical protein
MNLSLLPVREIKILPQQTGSISSPVDFIWTHFCRGNRMNDGNETQPIFQDTLTSSLNFQNFARIH